MTYQPKPGSGTLFRADSKKSETDRDFNGKIVLPDGTEHWLSGWAKTSHKTEKRVLSLQIGKPTQWKGDINASSRSQMEAVARYRDRDLDGFLA